MHGPSAGWRPAGVRAWLHRAARRLSPGRPPPEFDPIWYARIYEDVRGLSVRERLRHYRDRGLAEGRIGSEAAYRGGFLKLVPRDADVLEIGPAVRPVLRGARVRYFDVADRAGLVARALAEGYPADDCPEIDYVSPTGDLAVVRDRFDVLFSSHCIEHQPDLVSHLHHAARLLKPGGRYFLVIPDKRYCFDHFLPESDLDAVLAAHAERRRLHTARSVYEHRVLTTHNDAAAHWRGDHGDPSADRTARETAAADEMARSAAAYVDVHAWQFTPANFRRIVGGLRGRGLCELAVERVYETVRDHHEFTAVLRRPRLLRSLPAPFRTATNPVRNSGGLSR